MKPYRTEEEAWVMLLGEPDHRPYRELLDRIPCKELRGLMDRRVDKKYKQFKMKNELEILRCFNWRETPEGGCYWAKVMSWMVGLNDLPELAKGEESVK